MHFAIVFLLMNLFAPLCWSMASHHAHLINLPSFLKNRGLYHGQCDCHDLVHEGHFCGSHALTHALTVEQKFGVRPVTDYSASFQVKAAFARRNFNDEASRISSRNFDIIANDLGLNFLHLSFNQHGQVKLWSHDDNDLWAPMRAIAALENFRNEFYRAKPGEVVVKHIFPYIPPRNPRDNAGHVVHFAAVFDGQKVILTLLDNLNETVAYDSPIHRYAEFLITFFLGATKPAAEPASPTKGPKTAPQKPVPGAEQKPSPSAQQKPAAQKPETPQAQEPEEVLSRKAYEIATGLMYKLITYNPRDKAEYHIIKFYDYETASQHLSFLEFLFNLWLTRETEHAIDHNEGISNLNALMKSLKELHAEYPHTTVKEMVLRTYEAMIQVTNESKGTYANKFLQLDKILAKLKEASRNGYFSLDGLSKASQIFDCTQYMRRDYEIKAGLRI